MLGRKLVWVWARECLKCKWGKFSCLSLSTCNTAAGTGLLLQRLLANSKSEHNYSPFSVCVFHVLCIHMSFPPVEVIKPNCQVCFVMKEPLIVAVNCPCWISFHYKVAFNASLQPWWFGPPASNEGISVCISLFRCQRRISLCWKGEGGKPEMLDLVFTRHLLIISFWAFKSFFTHMGKNRLKTM